MAVEKIGLKMPPLYTAPLGGSSSPTCRISPILWSTATAITRAAVHKLRAVPGGRSKPRR